MRLASSSGRCEPFPTGFALAHQERIDHRISQKSTQCLKVKSSLVSCIITLVHVENLDLSTIIDEHQDKPCTPRKYLDARQSNSGSCPSSRTTPSKPCRKPPVHADSSGYWERKSR